LIDELKNDVVLENRIEMEKNSSSVEMGLGWIATAKNLERMADHATNIAEDVIFWVRGADVRHHITT